MLFVTEPLVISGAPLTIDEVERVAGRACRIELAGHMDLATTQRYVHLSPAAIHGAIRLLDQAKPVHGFGDILETEDREIGKSLP